MAALDAGQPGYGFGHELGGDRVDLHSGVSPVACLEALVVELAIGDVEVELDDGVPVVGLLADDVRESSGPFLFCFVVIAHEFYYRATWGIVKPRSATQIHHLICTGGVTDCL